MKSYEFPLGELTRICDGDLVTALSNFLVVFLVMSLVAWLVILGVTLFVELSMRRDHVHEPSL